MLKIAQTPINQLIIEKDINYESEIDLNKIDAQLNNCKIDKP